MKTQFFAILILGLVTFSTIKSTFAEFGEELRAIRSNNPMAEDEFGYSVALDGTLAIFGSPGRDTMGNNSGSAFIFDVTTGEQLWELQPDDPTASKRFGESVSIDNHIAIVGAHQVDGGSAYLFDVSTGKQLHKLVADDRTGGDQFGVSVDIENNLAIVGAHLHEQGGKAYLFDVTSGDLLRGLQRNDFEPDERFGISVALSGNRALVGARFDDELGFRSGSAYLFDTTSGQQIHKLNTHDGVDGDRFGMYVDIEDNTALIAARFDDDNLKSSGSAYLFDVDTGKERFKIVADDADPNDHFGSAVSLSGDLALVGAIHDTSFGNFSGSAYLYDINTGEQLKKLNNSTAGFFQRFGSSVAIDGDLAVVGAMEFVFAETADGLTSGSGYVFDVAVPEPKSFGVIPIMVFTTLVDRRRRKKNSQRLKEIGGTSS